MAPTALSESRVLGRKLGHYRIVEKIGAGGMGEVYRARDEHLDRDVAIKLLPPGTFADEQARKRFRREALALSKLNHPNIATIYDFDTQGNIDFLVMEYVAGSGVQDRMLAGKMAEDEVLRTGTELAEGVAAAHECGIIHRDLKPGNLRLTLDGRLKILDFGLAKLLRSAGTDVTASITESRGAAGTLPYMAPEQLRGKAVDERTDIYGIGAVLYELVTGQLPFEERVSTMLADRILHELPPPPNRLRPGVSPKLQCVILRCLEKDPAKRYQSVADLLGDLRTCVAPAGATSAAKRRAFRLRLAVGAVVALLGASAAVLIAFRSRHPALSKAPHIESLAVLPLANLSYDPGQEYFADGMTEALITELSRINSLKVISRTSVMRYKATNKPLPEIARELGVDGVIEGSVLRAGDRVRITTQLIYAPTDTHVWANSYDRDLRDILALQAEVADAIAIQVRAAVSREERHPIATGRTVDPEAYNLYLQGRFWWNKRTNDGMNRARELFTQATDLDPSYAPAYAGLADTLNMLSYYSAGRDRELFANSEAAARRAIELDPSLSEPHTVLGTLAEDRNDWSGAERELRRAMELDPNSATAHHRYAGLLHILGRDDEGVVEINRAHQLDPMSMMIATLVGAFHRYQNRYSEAEAQLKEVLKMDADFSPAHGFLMAVYEETGRLPQAIDEQERYLTLFGKQDPAVIQRDEATLRKALAEGGSRGYFLKSIELLETEPARKFSLYTNPARYYLLMGEDEKALAALAAEDCRTGIYAEEVRTPSYWRIRSDPRFQQVLRCMGLPP